MMSTTPLPVRQIFTPLFAASRDWKVVVTLVVFYIMLGLWCTLGYVLIRLPLVAKGITRYGKVVIPAVFIGIGVYILWVRGQCLSHA
jgi:cadmium resistance protein CadD (predicted permease)